MCQCWEWAFLPSLFQKELEGTKENFISLGKQSPRELSRWYIWKSTGQFEGLGLRVRLVQVKWNDKTLPSPMQFFLRIWEQNHTLYFHLLNTKKQVVITPRQGGQGEAPMWKVGRNQLCLSYSMPTSCLILKMMLCIPGWCTFEAHPIDSFFRHHAGFWGNMVQKEV